MRPRVVALRQPFYEAGAVKVSRHVFLGYFGLGYRFHRFYLSRRRDIISVPPWRIEQRWEATRAPGRWPYGMGGEAIRPFRLFHHAGGPKAINPRCAGTGCWPMPAGLLDRSAKVVKPSQGVSESVDGSILLSGAHARVSDPVIRGPIRLLTAARSHSGLQVLEPQGLPRVSGRRSSIDAGAWSHLSPPAPHSTSAQGQDQPWGQAA